MCFQRPQDQLFAQSVAEDIAFGPTNKGFSPDDVEALVAYAAARVGIDQQVMDASPLTLSWWPGSSRSACRNAGLRNVRGGV